MMHFGSGGPSAVQANAAAGLPYANVPGSLAEKVDEVLAREPVHPTPDITFERARFDRRPFGLRSFLGPHAWALAFAFVLVIVETISLQSGPYLTKIAIDSGIAKREYSVVVTATIVLFATIILTAVATAWRTTFTGRLGERLMYGLRVRVFAHMQRQSLGFYTQEKAGVLMTRMTSDTEALSVLFQEGIVSFAVQALTVIVIAATLFLFNVKLAIVTLVAVVPPTMLISLWFRKVSDQGYTRVRNRIADVLSDLSESLSGIRVITAYNRRRHNVINHINVLGRHMDANLDTARANSIYAPSSEAIGILGQALILLIGGRMVKQGELSVGELAAFFLYLTAFFAPIQQLVQLYNTYQQGNAAIVKLRELLSTEPDVAESPTAVVLPPIGGAIELDHVSFGYDPDRPVLHDVSLRIAPGESVAVVGSTGAGKSTIAKLVVRFYDPQAGRVLIDGHDLRDVSITSLRRQLGVVPQEAFLFHGTMRDNIAFARPDASDDEILDACRAVGIDDVVARLPGGLDAPVHERGSSLSAGERQLLALARAFLARPRVLVLDEATSNLDLTSESKVERALDTVLEGRTAIIIAHRLATAMRCDRIAVVEQGTIVELGTHNDLVALGGRYAAMFETWMSHM